MMDENERKAWEKAFAAYGLDAATGRLFRGLTHNINGVAQAFSMQAELLQMFIAQAGGLLSQAEQAATLAEAGEVCRKLQAMLARRAPLVEHLEREVQVLREIMGRCSGLVAGTGDPASAPEFSLQTVLASELEFLNGDGFFKHKVKKELALATDLPLLSGFRVEIHQVVFALLENAAQAMQASFGAGPGSPVLEITVARHGDQVWLAVSDNGEGIPADALARIFEPFYSTRPGRLGLGLFLARRLAERFGGCVSAAAVAGRTTFTLTMPLTRS